MREWPALVAVVIWGSLAAIAGHSLSTLHPAALFTTALLAAAASFTGLELARGHSIGRLLRPPRASLVMGLAGLGGYHALLFGSYELAPVIEANLVNDVWPLLTVVFGARVSGERLSPRLIAGTLAAFGGVLVIVGADATFGQPTSRTFVGYGLALAAGITWAAFSARLKSHPLDPSALPLASLLSGIAGLGWMWLEGAAWPTGRTLVSALYLGVLPISGATLLWEWGIRRGRVTVAGLLSFLTPLLATLGVVLFLGAPLRAGTVVGGGLILLGAALGLDRSRAQAA